MNVSRRGFLLSGLSLASGCKPIPDRPPLEELYRHYGSQDQPPLILIPGAFGSRLREIKTGKEVWPGSDARLLFSNYKGLEVSINEKTLDPNADEIEAYRLFGQGLGRDFYRQVVRMLEQAGGFQQRLPGDPIERGQRNFYVYLYDWRLDNTASVQGLHDLIEQIRHDYQNPHLKVDILAHSNGGMLARYYARYGIDDHLDTGKAAPNYLGTQSIRRLLLVGTPNLGTIQPVLSLIRGEDIGLRNIPSEIVATTTGAPQLMLHPSTPWLLDSRGNIIDVDIFDIDTWRQLKWSIFDNRIRNRTRRAKGGGAAGERYLTVLESYLARHLSRGRNFMTLMTTETGPEDIVPYVYGGDCEPTLARIVVEDVRGKLVARERPEAIARPLADVDYDQLMYDPGDSVVTRASLLGRCEQSAYSRCDDIRRMNLAHSIFICEMHQTLTSNIYFQNNILHNLLSKQTKS